MTLPQALLVFSNFPVDFSVLKKRDPLKTTKQNKKKKDFTPNEGLSVRSFSVLSFSD